MAFLVIFGMHVCCYIICHGDKKTDDNCIEVCTIFGEEILRCEAGPGAPTAKSRGGEVYKRYPWMACLYIGHIDNPWNKGRQVTISGHTNVDKTS